MKTLKKYGSKKEHTNTLNTKQLTITCSSVPKQNRHSGSFYVRTKNNLPYPDPKVLGTTTSEATDAVETSITKSFAFGILEPALKRKHV